MAGYYCSCERTIVGEGHAKRYCADCAALNAENCKTGGETIKRQNIRSLGERLRDVVEEARVSRTFTIPAHFGSEAADALDAKDEEIALMKAGRKLHDELADHLEADLEAAREALYTLVSHAALHEEYTSHPTDEDVVQISLGELRRAREALAAIRAKEHQPPAARASFLHRPSDALQHICLSAEPSRPGSSRAGYHRREYAVEHDCGNGLRSKAILSAAVSKCRRIP
jgi:peptidoglycan/xylan/chitin deacetylase (PgdA/CDA1 family)